MRRTPFPPIVGRSLLAEDASGRSSLAPVRSLGTEPARCVSRREDNPPLERKDWEQLGIDPGSTTVELSATVETPVGEFAHCVYCLLCFDVLDEGSGLLALIVYVFDLSL